MASPFEGLFTGQSEASPTPAQGGSQFSGLFSSAAPAPKPVLPAAPVDTGGYGAAKQTDVSGRPLATVPVTIPKTFMSPETTISQVDKTRVAPTFDPTKPQKIDATVLKNGRMDESASKQIKNAIGGTAAQELDHIMPLELGGSNDKMNLRLEQNIPGTKNTATDPIENQLARKAMNGEISALDAWRNMAKTKGITLLEDKAKNSPLNQYLLEHPRTLLPLAGAQEAITGAAAKVGNFFKGLFTNPNKTVQETATPVFNALGGNAIVHPLQTIKNIGDSVAKDAQAATSNLLSSAAQFKSDVLTPSTNRTAPDKVASTLNLLHSLASFTFLPISETYNIASQLPAIKPASDGVGVIFNTGGQVVAFLGDALLDGLPISQEWKDKLAQPIHDVSTLAGQIILGGYIYGKISAGMDAATAAKDAASKADDINHASAWSTLGKPATMEEAQANYRELAHQNHPDKLGGSDEAMSKINTAYDLLKEKGIPDAKLKDMAPPPEPIVPPAQKQITAEAGKSPFEGLLTQKEAPEAPPAPPVAAPVTPEPPKAIITTPEAETPARAEIPPIPAKIGTALPVKTSAIPPELEGLHKANPSLFLQAQRSPSVDDFIKRMSNGKPETVDTKVLTDFYNKVNPATPTGMEPNEYAKQLMDQQGVGLSKGIAKYNFTQTTVPSEKITGGNLGKGSGEKTIVYWQDKIKAGDRTPVVLIKDAQGSEVIDGMHKLQAYRNLGIKNIPSLVGEKGAAPQSIPKELQPLAEEARKYKSAEDFVGEQTPIEQLTETGKEGKFWTSAGNADEGFGSKKNQAFVDTSKLYQEKAYRAELRAGSIDPGAIAESIKETASNVKEYIKQERQTGEITKNVEGNFFKVRTAVVADEIRAKEILKNTNLTPEDAAAIYKYSDALDTNQKPPELTTHQKQVYEDTIRPIQEASKALFEKLKNEGVPLDTAIMTRRFVADRGGIFERLKDLSKKSVGGGGLLGRSTGAFKHRTMMALEDDAGVRRVVSIKRGAVVGWDNKQATPLGNLNLKTYEDLLKKETDPIDTKIKKLQKELDTLTATKGRTEASPIRIQNIGKEMVELSNERATVEDKYALKNLDNKVFTDSTGKSWRIKNATTEEIEKNTSLTYHKNILLNELISYNKLRQIGRAVDFLDAWKKSDDFSKIAMKYGEANTPSGWRSTDLAQFRGYAFDPKVADALDMFAKQMRGGDPTNALSKINEYLRTAIFFQPFLHVPNITVHWLVNRGVSPFALPSSYGDLYKTSDSAIAAILHPTDAPKEGLPSYTELLDHGANLQYSRTTKSLTDLMREKMGEELLQNKTQLQKMSDAFGYANPMKLVDLVFGRRGISSKMTWFTNDLATVQAVYEEMGKGKNIDEAIAETAKHIPNYEVPSRVLNSTVLAKAMKNPNITMFSAYHYGALKSYGEMMKTLVKDVPPGEKAKVIDKLAMLALIAFVIYPQLDKLAKQISGKDTAKFRRAGAVTFPYNVYQTATGKMDYATLLQSVFTPSVGSRLGIEAAFNKDLLTGQPLIRTGSILPDIGTAIGKSIAPVYQAEQLTGGSKTMRQFLSGLIGVNSPTNTPSERNINAMLYDERNQRVKEVKDAIDSGDDQKAASIMQEFNDRLVKNVMDALEENGHPISDRKAMLEYLVDDDGSGKGALKGKLMDWPSDQTLQNYVSGKGKGSLEKIIPALSSPIQ